MRIALLYPILSQFSIDVGDEVTHVIDANMIISDPDGRVRLKLNSTNLSGVGLDDSYPLTVTPCNAVTCRTSTPVSDRDCNELRLYI
jgi:hypothetical protein